MLLMLTPALFVAGNVEHSSTVAAGGLLSDLLGRVHPAGDHALLSHSVCHVSARQSETLQSQLPTVSSPALCLAASLYPPLIALSCTCG